MGGGIVSNIDSTVDRRGIVVCPVIVGRDDLIMAKLGVGRRAEVAAWVASTGVLHSRLHGDDREE
jgi:hypothetical protein